MWRQRNFSIAKVCTSTEIFSRISYIQIFARYLILYPTPFFIHGNKLSFLLQKVVYDLSTLKCTILDDHPLVRPSLYKGVINITINQIYEQEKQNKDYYYRCCVVFLSSYLRNVIQCSRNSKVLLTCELFSKQILSLNSVHKTQNELL